MPGRKINENEDPTACRRCGAPGATITTRQDRFCTECYTRFVSTKIIKRMEAFRVRNARGTHGHDSNGIDSQSPRKLLLALSLGTSSLALLHVLDGQIERQIARTGQAGFQLLVVNVDVDAAGDVDPGEVQEEMEVKREKRTKRWEYVKERYPRQEYLERSLLDSIPSHPNGHDPSNNNEPPSSTQPQPPPTTSDSPLNLATLQQTLPSPTSRADLASLRLLHTLTATAHTHSCTAILFASTTTTLAQKILAETAKGRGFALPWLVNDGLSPYHGLEFRYPMRDLFSKEVEVFAGVIGVPVHIEGEEVVGMKKVREADKTIDALMRDYFESVERDYPSIVANVVKTSGKLGAPVEAAGGERCGLCGLPVVDGRFGIHGWGGYEEVEEVGAEERLCYGCARSVLGAVNVP